MSESSYLIKIATKMTWFLVLLWPSPYFLGATLSWLCGWPPDSFQPELED